MIFPWQETQWQQLQQAKQAARLPHAILLAGVAGLGKTQFAAYLAQSLLCQTPSKNGRACETCHACRLVKTRVHVDVLHVAPEEGGHIIKVEQIRAVTEFVNQSSLEGQYRFVMINPAHALNINAANALLKTLEEPAAGAILILITDRHGQLPATLLSRCQKIIFAKPSQKEALNWLQTNSVIQNQLLDPILLLNLANGAPLAAIALVEQDQLALRKNILDAFGSLHEPHADPIKAVSKIHQLDIFLILNYLLSISSDLLRLQLGASPEILMNQDYLPMLIKINHQLTTNHIMQVIAEIQCRQKELRKGINLNKQLLLETIFISWMDAKHVFS